MIKEITFLVATLCIGCSCSQQSTRVNERIAQIAQIESNAELDSIPLTRYEYKIRGNSKYDIGDKLGSIEDYTRAIIVDPLYDSAYYNRANAKSDLRDREGAIADYSKVLEINPKFLDAYINRGVTKYEIKDYEGAIADFRLAIEHCPPDADIYNNLGRVLYDLKRFKESAEAYGEGIVHFPKDYKLYYGRGLARNQSGDKKGACEDWRKSSSLGCFEANYLLPLCDDCETDETKDE